MHAKLSRILQCASIVIAFGVEAQPALEMSLRVAETCVLGQPHHAELSIRNATKTAAKLKIMSCGYFRHFETDSDHIKVASWPCYANEPREIKIGTRASESFQIPLYFEGEALGQAIEFRVKFSALEDSGPLLWSPRVKVRFSKSCPKDPWTAGLDPDSNSSL